MGILDKVKEKVKSILPKRKEPELKNNVPKEKEHIRNTFGEYCNANHGTEGGKLCAKCTAVLSTVLIKISRCPYGIGKPICEQCETPCFGERFTNDFNTIMKGGQKKMLLSHPIMTVKHKIAGLGAEYAKMQRDKKSTEKQKEDAAKIKNKFANATRSPKKSKSKKRKKK
ncbi:MAG: nitrous oxide-stimulated promoter family protein [Fibrobacter sp.]|nr:nitrous oxide-stimulated promoter family protein [Fibrobacter sp.]MBR2096171.1 nitrous oxide-stimulated promoter family protein [Fibrobacter sp.]MBR7024987.1 nitrous oxide-stimulated promoter family protein [Selenomonadaceae bacterium]